MSFDNEDDAVIYAVICQRNRRNAAESDIILWIKEVDKRKTKVEAAAMTAPAREANRMQASIEACITQAPPSRSDHGKSATATAAIVGVSRAKVERARRVIDNPEVMEQVTNGTLTIHAASEKVLELKRTALQEKPAMPSHIANAKPVKAKYDAGDAYAKLAREFKKLAGDLPDARPDNSHGARTRVLFALTDLDKAVKSIRKNLTT